MKKLLALLLLGALVLSVLPGTLAVIPQDEDPEFAMKINGEFTATPEEYPEDGLPLVFEGIQYCNTFEVELIAWAVVDLYAYSLRVTWDTGHIELVDSEVKSIHTDDFPIHTDSGDGYYEQAVTAIAPAEGFTGTAAVANLYFHIYNDAQWPDQVDIRFVYEDTDMSDSCGVPIENSEQGGFVKLVPVQPTIKMLPPVTIKSVIGETFEVQFEIQDIVKMKSFFFIITYDPTQITTDAQNVWIKDFLPPPYEFASIHIEENCTGYVFVSVVTPCEKPTINGTGELLGIRFTTLNPWPDDIPDYDYVEDDHPIWFPEVCWNYINIFGFIDKDPCGIEKQWLGHEDGVTVKGPDPFDLDEDPDTKFIYDEYCSEYSFIIGYYEFRPIPGDLNLDGHVDIEDLSAIAKAYGCELGDPEWDDEDHNYQIFDLKEDNVIDIYDVIIVAKNFCRTEPDPDNPWPLFDP